MKYCLTGEKFVDLFTNPMQGATFQRFRDTIKGIPKSTPDVEMICPRDMDKIT